MSTFPIYHDAVAMANLKKGQLPLYITVNSIEPCSPLHHHDYVEFSFVFQGSGTEIINGQRHAMHEGTASFLLPHHIHEIHSDPENPIRLFCCMFDISILFVCPLDYGLSNQLMRMGNDLTPYAEFDREDTIHMKNIFMDILKEYEGSAFGKYSLIRAKLIEALMRFVRTVVKSGNLVDSTQTAVSDSNHKMRKIIQYIHLHYRDKITLEDLSRRFKVNVPYFSKLFKKHCGQNFLEYLHELRIQRSLSLLVSTEMAIYEIATEVGFDSFRTFSRVFKEYKGLTPSEYRQNA